MSVDNGKKEDTSLKTIKRLMVKEIEISHSMVGLH